MKTPLSIDHAPGEPIFLSLGSNMGDREAHLRSALAALAGSGARPLACSPIYATAPVGGPPQEEYLNLVVRVEPSLEPPALLAAAARVEALAGRTRTERWGPRTLDIDILLYGNRVISGRDLDVPHPRLHLRRFVLVPLADLAADAVHPVLRRSVGDLLARCPDNSAVTRHSPPPVPDS